MSPNQYGFLRGRSTEDAVNRVLETASWAGTGYPQYQHLCALVTLDVRNAFNSAPWDRIDEALRARDVPPYLVGVLRSYMGDRSLSFVSGDTQTNLSVTCGVPQGSVLGPTLWNVFYDGLLRADMPDGVQLVGFADDLAVVATARSTPALEAVVNLALSTIESWMATNGLQLAYNKTRAVMLTRKRNYGDPLFLIGGCPVSIERCVKYLGVHIDAHRTFTRHLRAVSEGASKAAVALGRLMPNVGGPSQAKRALLMSVTHSRLLYAATTWADRATKFGVNLGAIARAQRTAALRVVRAYRTVSTDAALLIAGIPPGDLLALERARVTRRVRDEDNTTPAPQIKKEERALTICAWQKRWARVPEDNAGQTARWTRRLLPNVGRWVRRRGGLDVTYHLSQALTGHGCFNYYLARIGRINDPSCLYCGDPADTAEHTLFACSQWTAEREAVSRHLGREVSADDVEDLLCGPAVNRIAEDWEDTAAEAQLTTEGRRRFLEMVRAIIITKENDERARQRNGQGR